MLRAEHCICGTSTTGTGTLTLAACPAPPGGTDLFQAFNAQSLGTSVAIPVSYTIVEYTGSDFQTALQQEKGVGSLTLGASVTATTLARTTVQQTATSMNTTATYDTSDPAAITIATAANVLVFIGSSATDLVVCSPYFDTTLTGSDAIGVIPVNASDPANSLTLTNARDFYFIFEWRVSMLVKRMTVKLTTGNSGTSSLYGRLYAIGANARPTKLLYDFGTFVGTNILRSVNVGNIRTSATGSGFYMTPGEYYIDISIAFSGSGTPVLKAFSDRYNSGRLGVDTAGTPCVCLTSTSPIAGPGGDPANITAIRLLNASPMFFALNTT